MIKDSALKYLEKSVDVNVETGNLRSLSTAYNNLCLYYYYQKDTAKAIEYSRKSLSTRYKAKDTPGLIYSLSNMARLFLSYKIARQDSIIYYVSEAEKHARLVNTPRELKMTAMYLSEIWSLNNNADSAIKYMNRIKVLLDDMLRLNYYILGEKEKEQYYATLQGDYGVIYKTTAHFHKERPWLTDTAYNTVLRNKGLTLQSSTFIRQAIYNSNDSSLKSDYEKWIQLKKEIAALYMRGKDISKQDSIVRVQERTLIKRLNIEPARRVNWKEVQAALKPGEAAVEFIRHIQGIDIQYEYKYAAMMIKPGLEHPLFIPLCVEDTLRDILSRLKMNSLSEQRHLKALYKEVWEPLETHLSGIKTVFVSPEGLLHRVSYAALPVEKDILLCDKYQIRNRPSTGRIALQKNIAPDNFETLLFGGVDYGNPTDKESIWSYLPGTMTEVQSIEKQLLKAGKKVEKATGTSADEITFKQKSAQAEIIHLASHGFFYPDPENKKFKEEKEVEVTEQMNFRSTRSYGEMNFVYSTNPLMRTGIAMSGANKGWSAAASPENDGVLTAAEISHLNLQKSKLVVLSACETGLGEIVDNEGVFGLQRAFLLAGTDALIMSLWQVPDKETSEFMTLFYKNLLKKKEIHTAFLLTQKSMRKKYPALYWAGFILLE
jgi:CHAT domain-containing protein